MKNNNVPYKTYLTESELPRAWYNIRANMKNQPAPFLNPQTMKELKPEELYPIFAKRLVELEFDETNEYIDIPDEVFNYYKTYRPSPLVRAYNLEKALDTPAKIYYKFEGSNTSGSHKLNAAAAMVYYAKKDGAKQISTETGAGQWGTALAMACAFFGLDLSVFMVKCSTEQKPYRKTVIETYGGKVIPSPSLTTESGRAILKKYPDTSGSLGCAISEAVEYAFLHDDCRYALGSVLNQVLLFQSLIGLESKKAMEKLGEYPDIIIGCAGGGSNIGGLLSPFMKDKIQGNKDFKAIAVEPESCPTLTKGKYAYDFCDTGHITPLAKMYTLGSDFIPSPTHAGGLRYHGMSPIVSQLYHDNYMEAISVGQVESFSAAKLFLTHEQILPAPESSHAIWAAIEEAKKCKETGEEKSILFCLSGTGYFDMQAYDLYNKNEMNSSKLSDDSLQDTINKLPKI